MLLHLAILTTTAAGAGFWIWWLAGPPRPERNMTWRWCGAAGFAVHALVLQGLVYLDVPLHRSAPWALGVVVAGGSALRSWTVHRQSVSVVRGMVVQSVSLESRLLRFATASGM